jgi:superfamily II DNA or RNA helicase
VLVSTYETIRQDVATKRPGSRRALDDGPLMATLLGKRVLVIYDEAAAKLKNRSNALYRHHEHMLKKIRKTGSAMVIGLTATLVERDPETVFNVARLIDPSICTVAQFEKDHVAYRNQFFEVAKWINISREKDWDGTTTTLREKIDPLLLVKSRDEPDVRDLFPQGIEEFSVVEMTPGQKEIYDAFDAITDEIAEDDEVANQAAFIVLRQIAGIPEALTLSTGKWARALTAHYGIDHLRSAGAGKLDRAVQWATTVASQNAQMIVFTFFGQSILPILEREMTAAGLAVSTVHGQMSAGQRTVAIDEFRAGRSQVLLTSDANSRGVNLPEASYTLNFELPVLYSTYMQRIGRANRIYSPHSVVFSQSFITHGTVESSIATGVTNRNEWDDMFGDFDDFNESGDGRLTARHRKLLMSRAKADRKKTPVLAGIIT